MTKKITLTTIKIFSLFLLFLTANTIHAQQGDNGTIDVPGDIAIIAFNKVFTPTSKSDYAFLLLDDCINLTTIVFDDEEWTGSAFGSPIGEGANTWINDTGSTILKGTVIQISSGNDLPTASMGSVTESDSGFNLAAGDQLYAYFGTRAAPTTFLAFYGELTPTNGEIAVLSGTGLVAGSTAISSSNLGYYSGSTVCNGSTADCLNAISNPPTGWTTGEFNFPTGVPSSFTGSTFAAPNTAPVATAFSTPTVAEDAMNVTLSGASISDAETADTQTVTVTSTGGTITLGGSTSASVMTSGNAATVTTALNGATFTPTTNFNGAASISIVSNDGTVASNTATVNFTVSSVNDEPSFTVSPKEVVDEDAGPQTVTGFATALEDGDAEVTQTLLFNVSNNNNGLFSAQPAIDASGNLTYTTATNLFGTATVMVNIMDNGGTANAGDDDTSDNRTFTITVNQVNDTPVVITSISDDTGSSNTDYITNDNKPTVNGTAEPGSIITLIINGLPTTTFGVTATTNSMGVFAFRFPAVFGSLQNNATATISARAELNRITLSSPNQPVTVDISAPIISSITRQNPTTSSTNTDALVWDVTFDNAVVDVDTTDFAVIGTTATVSSITNPSGNTYRVTVSGGDLAGLNATVTLGFNGGQNITDIAGNTLTNLTPTGTNSDNFVVDNTNPLISSITLQSPTTNPTNADALAWDVTFDGAVSNVDATDFTVSGTTATVASVTNPSGNTYRVTVSGGDLAGLNATVTLGFNGGQNITDIAGNTLTNLTPTGTNSDNFVVDNTNPLISSITLQSPTTNPTNADTLAWDVTFDGVVTNVDATDFAVSGTTATVASVTNPSGNVYRVMVSGGDLAGLNGTVTLGFSGGQNIADASGNTLTNLTPTGTNNNTFVIDNTPPVYTWTGVSNSTWGVSSNWNPTNVPPANADIIIPSGLNNYPTANVAVTFNSLTINSGATFKPNSTVTGPVTYKRNLPTTNWYLVAAPVNGETQQDVIASHTFANGTGSNIGLGGYLNNTGPSWIYSTATSTGAIPSGIGISMKLTVPGDVSITGSINTSNVSFPVNQGTRDNFNLLGNPYTSYINSAAFTTTNTTVLTEETIWLWDGTQYVTYNAVSPIEIAPAQGFFVEASTNNTVLYSTSNRSHQNTDTFMRQTPKTSFELFVENDASKKSTKVFYVANKTTGFDNGYDSKIFSGVKEDFTIYTELLENNKGKKLAIQTLPNTNLETMVIPIGLTTEAGKELTFSVSSKNLPEGMDVYLEDRIANTFTNLSQGNYKITVKNTSKSTGQFYIHTTSKKLENIPTTQELQNVSIYRSTNNTLIVAGLQTDNASLNIYSILGKKIISTQFKSTGVHIIKLPEISKGVYIVELKSDLGKISKKIILE
ncbi:T9SS type A sorting domain-containing protein [Tenacibaculum bernardetii]|uniref:T9SS type A sorting domain-containing protein n=1 Tax=Tenacibaculum bernardetii TaxID=3021375 RepID=UPI0023B14936|nr:Ig-like domain-containing protein [Tenacibaculum bernardetii]